MGLDDVLKSFAAFNQGMTQYKISQATNQAQEQLQSLQANEDMKKDLNLRLQAQTGIANELALKMTGAGANASEIGAATSNLGLSAGQQALMGLVPASESFKRQQVPGYGNLSSDVKYEADMKAAKEGGKAGQTLSKEELADMRNFGISAANKPYIEGLQEAKALQQALKPINGRVDPAQVIAGIRRYIKASGDNRISNEDIKGARPNQSTKKAIARKLGIEVSDQALQSDVNFFNIVANNLVEYNASTLRQRVNDWGKSFAETKGTDAQDYTNRLGTRYGIQNAHEPDQAPAAQAPAQKQGRGLKNFLRKAGQ